MDTKTEIRIVIADDHVIFRQGLRHVIESAAGLKVVGEAADGEAALARIEESRPDVALLDIDMPLRDGYGVVRALRDRHLPVEVVFLTMHKDELHLNEALDLGVKGYIVKDGAAAEAVDCLRAVRAGASYISPALSTYLLNRSRRSAAFSRQQPALSRLTPTERRVLCFLAEYRTSKEIASSLGVSTRTIENHRANICNKLEMHGTHALVKFALQHKSEIS
jgi:DNA-binding NarL/FixJ family response regulator